MQYDDTPPKIRINNAIAKSNIVPPFSLSSLSATFPFSTQHVLSRIFLSHPTQHSYFSIFNTGSVISRSSRSVQDAKGSFHWLRSFLAFFNLELSTHYDILNIVASSNLAPALNLSALSLYLPYCSYDPSSSLSDDGCDHFVNCITLRFHVAKPRYTALIFPTGNVTFTGFKSIDELRFHISKLSSLLSEIALNHPEVLAK